MTTEVQEAQAATQAATQAPEGPPTSFHALMRRVLLAHNLVHLFVPPREAAFTLEHPQKGFLDVRVGIDQDLSKFTAEFPNGDVALGIITPGERGTRLMLRSIRNKHTEEVVYSDQWADWLEEVGRRRWDRARIIHLAVAQE